MAVIHRVWHLRAVLIIAGKLTNNSLQVANFLFSFSGAFHEYMGLYNLALYARRC